MPNHKTYNLEILISLTDPDGEDSENYLKETELDLVSEIEEFLKSKELKVNSIKFNLTQKTS